MTRGEIGCALSHLEAHQRVAAAFSAVVGPIGTFAEEAVSRSHNHSGELSHRMIHWTVSHPGEMHENQ